jgi:hypothetical protein
LAKWEKVGVFYILVGRISEVELTNQGGEAQQKLPEEEIGGKYAVQKNTLLIY